MANSRSKYTKKQLENLSIEELMRIDREVSTPSEQPIKSKPTRPKPLPSHDCREERQMLQEVSQLPLEQMLSRLEAYTRNNQPCLSVPVTNTNNRCNGSCGDVNNDNQGNVLDIVLTVQFVLGNSSELECEQNADMDGDGAITVLDIVQMVNCFLGPYYPNCDCATDDDSDDDDLEEVPADIFFYECNTFGEPCESLIFYSIDEIPSDTSNLYQSEYECNDACGILDIVPAGTDDEEDVSDIQYGDYCGTPNGNIFHPFYGAGIYENSNYKVSTTYKVRAHNWQLGRLGNSDANFMADDNGFNHSQQLYDQIGFRVNSVEMFVGEIQGSGWTNTPKYYDRRPLPTVEFNTRRKYWQNELTGWHYGQLDEDCEESEYWPGVGQYVSCGDDVGITGKHFPIPFEWFQGWQYDLGGTNWNEDWPTYPDWWLEEKIPTDKFWVCNYSENCGMDMVIDGIGYRTNQTTNEVEEYDMVTYLRAMRMLQLWMLNGLYPYAGHDDEDTQGYTQIGQEYGQADQEVIENFCNIWHIYNGAFNPNPGSADTQFLINDRNKDYPFFYLYNYCGGDGLGEFNPYTDGVDTGWFDGCASEQTPILLACGLDPHVDGNMNSYNALGGLNPYPDDGGKHCAHCFGYSNDPWGPNSLSKLEGEIDSVSGNAVTRVYTQYGITTNGTVTNGWDYWWDIKFRGGSNLGDDYRNINNDYYNHYHVDHRDYMPFLPTPTDKEVVYLRGDCSNWTNGECPTHPGFPTAVGNPHCPQGVCGKTDNNTHCECHCPNGKVASADEVCSWSQGIHIEGSGAKYEHSFGTPTQMGYTYPWCFECQWHYWELWEHPHTAEDGALGWMPWCIEFGTEWNEDDDEFYHLRDISDWNGRVGIGTSFCRYEIYNPERCNFECDSYCSHHALKPKWSLDDPGQPDVESDFIQSPFYALDYPITPDPNYRHFGDLTYEVRDWDPHGHLELFQEYDDITHQTYSVDNTYGAQKFRYRTGRIGSGNEIDPFYNEPYNPYNSMHFKSDGSLKFGLNSMNLQGELPLGSDVHIDGLLGPTWATAALPIGANCGTSYTSYMRNTPYGVDALNVYDHHSNMTQRSHWNWFNRGVPAMYFRAKDYNPCTNGYYGSPSLEIEYEIHTIEPDDPCYDNNELIYEKWSNYYDITYGENSENPTGVDFEDSNMVNLASCPGYIAYVRAQHSEVEVEEDSTDECVDDNAAIYSGGLTCADVISMNFCDVPWEGHLFSYYCPVACGTCATTSEDTSEESFDIVDICDWTISISGNSYLVSDICPGTCICEDGILPEDPCFNDDSYIATNFTPYGPTSCEEFKTWVEDGNASGWGLEDEICKNGLPPVSPSYVCTENWSDDCQDKNDSDAVYWLGLGGSNCQETIEYLATLGGGGLDDVDYPYNGCNYEVPVELRQPDIANNAGFYIKDYCPATCWSQDCAPFHCMDIDEYPDPFGQPTFQYSGFIGGFDSCEEIVNHPSYGCNFYLGGTSPTFVYDRCPATCDSCEGKPLEYPSPCDWTWNQTPISEICAGMCNSECQESVVQSGQKNSMLIDKIKYKLEKLNNE